MPDSSAEREALSVRWSSPLHWTVAGVFLLSLLVSFAIVGFIESNRRQQAEHQAHQLAAASAHDFGTQLDRALSASYALATLVRQGKGRIDNFDELATEMLSVYGGISALQLAPGGTIRQVVPLAGNESVVGFSPLEDPVQGAATRRVIDSGKLGLVGPIILRQGGYGVIGRNPISLPGPDGELRFWGLTQVLVRISDLLAATRIDQLVENGYAYELWHIRPEDGSRLVFAGSGAAPLRDPVHEIVAVPGGVWTLSVAPVAGWASYVALTIASFAALLFSALIAFLVFLLLRQPMHLRQEVAARTAELQAQEMKYRLMFEHNPVPMFVFAHDNLAFLDANEAFLHAYGYTRDELRGMHVPELHPEEDRQRLAGYIRAAIGTGLRQSIGWRHRRCNGELVDVEVTSHDVDYLGRGARLVLAIDVTERKRAEEKLVHQNEWLKSILEHFPDGITVADRQTRIVAHNARFRELLEFPEEMLAGEPRKLIDFLRYNAVRGEYGEVDVEAYVAEAEKRINLNVSHHFERTRPNGVVLDVRGSPLPDGGLVTSYADVTERKAVEEALRAINQSYERLNAELEERVAERTRELEAEVEERRAAELSVREASARLREIIDTLSAGIVLWDAGQHLTAWNAAFEQMFPQAAPLLTAGMVRDELRQAMDSRGDFPLHSEESGDWGNLGRWDRHLPDGRTILIERLATRDGGRLVLHQDVTHERQTQDVLARNERMASLGNLVAGIAHEINTPIGNALMVSSSVGHRIDEFEADLAAGPLRRSSLERLLAALRESDDLLGRNLRRAASLIQNFKQVAVDQTSDQRRAFDLATVLEEIRMTLTPRLRHSTHRLELDIEIGVRMDGYPGALGQIVTNLVENALIHAFEGRSGGRLELRARRLGEQRVELLFRDDGVGIRPEVLPRIFDPFFTTRMGRGGSGLGLSIVFNLVRELLGGEMSVDSAVGRGTSFRIELPTVSPAMKKAPDIA